MKFTHPLVCIAAIFLLGCQQFSPRSVTILDGENMLLVTTSESTPFSILTEAGITTQPTDRTIINGIPYALDDAISINGNFQLQIQRTVSVRLVTPHGEQVIQTSAFTVGDILKENGISIQLDDEVQPLLTTPVTDSLTVTYSPARDLTISTGDASINIRSTAGTVGEALAAAGYPLMGLDTSSPAENEALPSDGLIKVTRITESVSVELQSIPFPTEETESADVAFGQQEILQNGADGVAMIRTRIRYEDGLEVNRTEEEKTILKEPITQVVLNGSKIVLAPVGGNAPYQYWFSTQMYASWYSPCNSGTGGCSYGTSSGARAGYGIVAVDYSIYPYLAGMKVYIPGYGLAIIGDSGGGPIIETAFGVSRTQWIDLGYDDNAVGALTGWVTVYFLEPAPAEIPYFLQ